MVLSSLVKAVLLALAAKVTPVVAGTVSCQLR
jgi:hypothetical protein